MVKNKKSQWKIRVNGILLRCVILPLSYMQVKGHLVTNAELFKKKKGEKEKVAFHAKIKIFRNKINFIPNASQLSQEKLEQNSCGEFIKHEFSIEANALFLLGFHLFWSKMWLQACKQEKLNGLNLKNKRRVGEVSLLGQARPQPLTIKRNPFFLPLKWQDWVLRQV